jgi:acetyl-CoA carboxylase carboxyl transferase subunit alpha
MAVRLKAVLLNQLAELTPLPADALVAQRYQRVRGYGAFVG